MHPHHVTTDTQIILGLDVYTAGASHCEAKWVVDPFLSPAEKAKPVKPGTQLYNDIHALALAGNRLYAVHKDGRLKVFNTANGKVLALRKVPAPMWDGLAIAGDKLYLTTKAGEVLCLGNETK